MSKINKLPISPRSGVNFGFGISSKIPDVLDKVKYFF
jgi:hypothetical protein